MKKYSIIAGISVLIVTAIALLYYSYKPLKVSAVPFGLPAKTKISVGEKAKFPSTPAPAEADLRRANDLRMAGAFQAAHDNYETILLKYPNLPAALFGKAYSIIAEDSVSAEKIAQTKSLIENLAQQKPGSVWVQLLLTFIREHEGSNALDMAAELAAKSPAFSEARLRYADLLFKAGQPAKSAEEAKAAISISAGTDARAYVRLAFALHKMNNLEECSELVNYALPRFPSQTGFLLLRGYLSEYAREFDKAQNDYKRILALKPGDPSALNAMATLGEKTSVGGLSALRDQAKESAKILLPLIDEYPENLPLREALGRIYLKARLMKEARQQFSEIYAQDFEYPGIRQLMNETVEEQPKFIPPPPPQNNKNLADSLAKTFAALRSRESVDYDDLGRYFMHYGATFKEFFSKYSVTRFKRLDENTFIERYKINSIIYENTIYFDSKKTFYAVRSIITDSASADLRIQDLFRHFLRKEAGVLGEGVPVEVTRCSNTSDEWEGFIWASRDNFEVLLYGSDTPETVYIIRLHANRFSDTGNLCSYVNMALGRAKTPRG